jgi:hypothetical protein
MDLEGLQNQVVYTMVTLGRCASVCEEKDLSIDQFHSVCPLALSFRRLEALVWVRARFWFLCTTLGHGLQTLRP